MNRYINNVVAGDVQAIQPIINCKRQVAKASIVEVGRRYKKMTYIAELKIVYNIVEIIEEEWDVEGLRINYQPYTDK